MTINADGSRQSCEYATSLEGVAEDCDVDDPSNALRSEPRASGAVYTKITFERRFTPGRHPDAGKLEHGDTLLGRHVLALLIDGAGAVRSCRIVAASGDMTPDYGCDEVRAERFQASAGRSASEARQGYLTILVYGHAEQIV